MDIRKCDVQYWNMKAKEIMKKFSQGKGKLEIQQVNSIFMKNCVCIKPEAIENIAGDDKQVDQQELAMLMYMLDGIKKPDKDDKTKYFIENDFYIDENGYKDHGKIG